MSSSSGNFDGNSGGNLSNNSNGNSKRNWLVDSVLRITEKCLDRPGALAVVMILITFFAILSIIMPLSWKYSSDYVSLGIERERNTLKLIDLQKEVLIDYKRLLENQSSMLANQGEMIVKQTIINQEMIQLIRELKINEDLSKVRQEGLVQSHEKLDHLLDDCYKRMTASVEERKKQHGESMTILNSILFAIEREKQEDQKAGGNN